MVSTDLKKIYISSSCVEFVSVNRRKNTYYINDYNEISVKLKTEKFWVFGHNFQKFIAI